MRHQKDMERYLVHPSGFPCRNIRKTSCVLINIYIGIKNSGA